MTDNSNNSDVEQRLLQAVPRSLPADARSAILGSVQSELHSVHWDRRLAWTATVLMSLAVGLNGFIGWCAHENRRLAEAKRLTPRTVAELAETIASVTDKETGQRFEQRMIAIRSTIQSKAPHDAMRRTVDEILRTWDLSNKEI